jgi:Lecithin retinol acyltransferase
MGLTHRDFYRDLAEESRLRRVESSTSPSLGELPLGCWLVTPRRGYTHHGVYVGNGLVVHYAGLSRSWRRGPVEVVPLSEFSLGESLWVRRTPAARHAGPSAVRRALSRLGEDAYRILTNNCEHFCAWCVEGDSRSLQVEQWLAWPRAIVRATVTRITRSFAC